ncbi:MAG: CIA30 family protein [Rhodocyclaceae bacterium]
MNRVLFNFAEAAAAASWQPINDSVMGGVSVSSLRFDPAGHAVFEGSVSFERNGGFASVRCLPQAFAIERAAGLQIEALGDGKAYKLNLRTDDGFDGVNYQTRFRPAAGAWDSCCLAVADFQPTWRGRPVPDAPPLALTRLRQVGLMIADRQAGPFRLAVRCISAIPAAVP